MLLALLSIVIVISGTFWYRQFASTRSDAPSVGGTVIVGVIGGQEELRLIATRLTKAGLFSIDRDGKLQNLLVSSWSVNRAQTEFNFKLRPSVNLDEISSALQSQTGVLGQAIVSTRKGRLVIKVSESNPSLPLLLARPFFDYGSYKVSNSSNTTAVFVRNTREDALPAFINKVVVHAYEQTEDLNNALKRRRLDIATSSEGIEQPSGYTTYNANLSRYYALLFNTNRFSLRDSALRQRLIQKKKPLNTAIFSLISPDQQPQRTLAEALVSRWKLLGAKVNLSLKPQDEIATGIAPARNFDAMVIGLDYGFELDPYYFWHSSQLRIMGNNFSGLNSPQIDKTLAKIRQSLNASTRRNLLIQLHSEIRRQAAGRILQQESVKFVVSSGVRFVPPFLASTTADIFQALPLWSVK